MNLQLRHQLSIVVCGENDDRIAKSPKIVIASDQSKTWIS